MDDLSANWARASYERREIVVASMMSAIVLLTYTVVLLHDIWVCRRKEGYGGTRRAWSLSVAFMLFFVGWVFADAGWTWIEFGFPNDPDTATRLLRLGLAVSCAVSLGFFLELRKPWRGAG